MLFVKLLTLIFASVLMAGCSLGSYVGYFYPSIENHDIFVESDRLGSMDECRDWVNSQIAIYSNKGYDFDRQSYDYECGVNCREGDDYNQGTKFTCKSSAR